MSRFLRALSTLLALSALLPIGVGATSDESEPTVSSRTERQILVTFEQRPTRRLPGAGSTRRGYAGRATYEASPRAIRLAEKLAKEYGLEHVDEWPIDLLSVHCVVYELPPQASVAEVLERLSSDPRVETVQPMQIFEVLGRATYDDPHFPLQHGLHSMQIEEAHRWSSGKGVRVAVIDTGVDVAHPELDGRIAVAENFVDNDSLGFARDRHGTAVAGVIASRAGNGIGIVGVAPSVKILALKACWERERGSDAAVCSTFTLAKAISFAVRKQADVLNLSLTGPSDPLLAALLTRAIDQGVLVVSASTDELLHGFPASLDRVVGVSATSGRDVGLVAPGDDVLTILPGGAYDFMSGSSLAAAHVSGVAALMLEQRPRLSHATIERLLRDTSRDAGDSVSRVNACAALAELLNATGCSAGETGRAARPTPGL